MNLQKESVCNPLTAAATGSTITSVAGLLVYRELETRCA
jgi:hypothetical protein